MIKPAASRFGRLAQMGMGANEVTGTGTGTGTGGPNQNALGLGYAPTAGKTCLNCIHHIDRIMLYQR